MALQMILYRYLIFSRRDQYTLKTSHSEMIFRCFDVTDPFPNAYTTYLTLKKTYGPLQQMLRCDSE